MSSKTQLNPDYRNRFANTLESVKLTVFHRYDAQIIRQAERVSTDRFWARGQFHRLTTPVLSVISVRIILRSFFNPSMILMQNKS